MPKKLTRPAPQPQIRYTLALSPELYDLVREAAEKKHTTIRQVIIRCIESALLK